MNQSLLQPFVIIKEQNLEISTGIKSNLKLENNTDEFFESDRGISDAISQASKHATNEIDKFLIFQMLKIKILITKDKLFQF
jgi:hypothetical protein